MTIRARVIPFLAFFSVALIALLLTEATLQILTRTVPAFEHMKWRTEPPVPSKIKRFDAQLGWALQPSSSGTSSRTGYEIEYKINSKGFRGDETSYKKPGGVYRIVVLGDSNTFGFGVPIEKHYSKLLEGYFKDVEVINLGVDAYGVDQELLRLRLEGCRYEPDLVLAFVPHYGDHRHMHSKRFSKPKPYFQLVDGKLVLKNVPVPGEATPWWRSLLLRPYHWIAKHSRIYGVLKVNIRQLRGMFRPSKDERKRKDDANARAPGFIDKLHKLGEAIIFEMNSEASRCGAKFVLVNEIRRLHAAAVDKGLFSINVTEALSNRKFSLPDNLKHINESGNGVLAWEIAQFLKTNELIAVDHLNP